MITKITGDELDIYLRKMTLDDTDLIIKWRNSEVVRPYFIYQETFTKEGHINWIKTMIEPGHGYQFMICGSITGDPLGCTYLRDYDPVHKRAEFGIFIGENVLHGKGVGKQATKLTLQYAFQSLYMNRVFARVLDNNQLSNGMFQSLNWTHEAILRSDVILRGISHDVNIYGILSSEYEKVNGYKEYIE